METRFFVLQVITGTEALVIRRAEETLRRTGTIHHRARLWWPRRRLYIRRRGRRVASLAPLFPGYLFLEIGEDDDVTIKAVTQVEGVIRFLRSNDNVQALPPRDLEVLRHFISFGEVAEASVVSFDENNRIQVKEGPLTGLEGQIVKVDRRKGRAKVKLDLYDDAFLIDLAFEVLQESEVSR